MTLASDKFSSVQQRGRELPNIDSKNARSRGKASLGRFAAARSCGTHWLVRMNSDGMHAMLERDSAVMERESPADSPCTRPCSAASRAVRWTRPRQGAPGARASWAHGFALGFTPPAFAPAFESLFPTAPQRAASGQRRGGRLYCDGRERHRESLHV